jgi:hypothetical protein
MEAPSAEPRPTDAPAAPRPRRRRRRVRWLVWIALAVLLLYFGGGMLVSPILKERLQAMVASHLNAELHIGHLRYQFPYGITVRDASLVAQGPNGPLELIKAKRIDLVLAELPKRHGPLVIKRLIFTEPTVQLIRGPGGSLVGRDLVRHDDHGPTFNPETMKLSDMFRLRRFAIEKGQIVYRNQTRAGTKPMVWDGIHVDLHTQPESKALYSYKFEATNAPLAMVSAAGTMDIDALRLDVKQFDLSVQAHQDASESKLPASLQQLLKSDPVFGDLRLKGTATLPLLHLSESRYDATVELPGVTAKLPQWDVTLDKLVLQLRITSEQLPADEGPPTTSPTQQPPATVRIAKLEAWSGDTSFRVDKGLLTIDPEARTWHARKLLGTLQLGEEHSSLPSSLRKLLDNVHAKGSLRFTATAGGPLKPPPGKRAIDAIDYELLAAPVDLTLQPKGFPLPFKKLAGSVLLRPHILSVQNLEGWYGADHLLVTSAKVPLDDPRHLVPVNDIDGSVDFGGRAQPYPKALEKTLFVLRPKGLANVSGRFTVHPGHKDTTEYHVGISADHAQLDVALDGKQRRLPASQVRTDLLVSGVGHDGVVQVNRVEAATLGGRFSGAAQFRLGHPLTYTAEAHCMDVDMVGLANVWALPGQKPPPLSGKGFADATLKGSGPTDGKTTLDLMQGEGEAEVLDGYFFKCPVASDIVSAMGLPQSDAVMGQAAATFHVHDGLVEFDHAAMNSPAVGLQGSGMVRFDGALDLRVIAAPLADWKKDLKRTGVPILSDVTAELAGGIQKILNGATRVMLYEFRVEGRLPHPELQTVPAPILHDGAAKLFGSMIAPKKGERLIDTVKREEK